MHYVNIIHNQRMGDLGLSKSAIEESDKHMGIATIDSPSSCQYQIRRRDTGRRRLSVSRPSLRVRDEWGVGGGTGINGWRMKATAEGYEKKQERRC